MKSNRILRAYCDCGHLSIRHIRWMENGEEKVKCFGADQDTYFRLVEKLDVDENKRFTKMVDTEVRCNCKKMHYINGKD